MNKSISGIDGFSADADTAKRGHTSYSHLHCFSTGFDIALSVKQRRFPRQVASNPRMPHVYSFNLPASRQ